MIETHVKSFNELTTQELYGILKLRSKVFVVEQECVYQDVDNKDQTALHLFMVKNHDVIAYTRLFAPGKYFKEASIGRVVVQMDQRKLNLGHLLIKESIRAVKEHFQTNSITISAQQYLKHFYESHQFYETGKGYLEDGIPHIRMNYKL